MNQRNYQKELDKTIEQIVKEERVPTLLLHSCCAPCSSYCLEYLSKYFQITVLYYNPNITEVEEYKLRTEEQKRLIEQLNAEYCQVDNSNSRIQGERYKIIFQEGAYEPKRFLEMSKGMEEVPEGGARCMKCFRLRLEEAAKIGKEKGFDYFSTTLTISPLKNAPALNAIGEEMGRKYGIAFLPSDFKKKNGYKRSIELSKEYQLYRQDYCGCIYSKRES